MTTTVELVGFFPHNEPIEAFIARIARVSTGTTRADYEKLIEFMWKNEHMSPFEFANFTFKIVCPHYVKVQILRHRTAKVSEFSQRYSVATEQRAPLDIRFTGAKNRQSSIRDDDRVTNSEELTTSIQRIENKLDDIYKEYEHLLSLGVARETARSILPVSTLTTLYWQMDLRNLMHFLKLRLADDTQEETRVVANLIYKLIKDKIPTIIKLF